MRAGKEEKLVAEGRVEVPPAKQKASGNRISLAGFDASGWSGLVAPRGTPIDIVERLHGEIDAGLADPRIMARLNDTGVTVFPLARADFGKLIADETEKWGQVIRAANIKPE